MYSTVIIIGFLSLLFSSCNKQEALPYFLISNDFARYCKFDEGSSWVFQNDSTLVTDSINISEIKESRRFQPDPIKHQYQATDMFMSDNVFQIARYEITAGDYTPESGEMNSLFRIYFEDGKYQIAFSPQFPIGEDIIMGDEIGVYKNVEIIADYQLNGNTYKDVWHTNVIVSVNNNIEYDYWIAKNYGLIKTVITNDGTTISSSLKSASLIQN